MNDETKAKLVAHIVAELSAPTPEQIKEWRNTSDLNYFNDEAVSISSQPIDAYASGYLRARTEQATEIAELKAKLDELMPLAKFGAMVLHTYSSNGDITEAQVNSAAKQTHCMGDAKAWTVFMPNIEATITKLLKD